jgi:hypothetical protein
VRRGELRNDRGLRSSDADRVRRCDLSRIDQRARSHRVRDRRTGHARKHALGSSQRMAHRRGRRARALAEADAHDRREDDRRTRPHKSFASRSAARPPSSDRAAFPASCATSASTRTIRGSKG